MRLRATAFFVRRDVPRLTYFVCPSNMHSRKNDLDSFRERLKFISATPIFVVTRKRAAVAEVIAYLAEIDRRRSYLDQACSSLRTYCIERLGYSEDETTKRVRVARLARRLPCVLDELRSGAVHLNGLFLLESYLTEQNVETLLGEARGLSRMAIEKLIARWFPHPDAPNRIDPVATQPGLPLGSDPAHSGRPPRPIGPGTSESLPRAKVEPLSAASYRVQFAASAELYAKIVKAEELLSHVVSAGDLPALFERAIDTLIEQEVRQRRGAGGKRERRVQKPGSRHVPVEVAAYVWKRDGNQCTFVDREGRRCSERRFLTLEHQHPYALGGPATAENVVLLCAAHNAHSAGRVFGDAHIQRKRRERTRQGAAKPATADPKKRIEVTVSSALCNLGFRKEEVVRALAKLRHGNDRPKPEALLRASLALLVPSADSR